MVRDGTLGDLEVFVRKSVAVAVFSSFIAFAIVVGCSAPSPDGSSLSRGRGSRSSSGDAEENTSSSSGSAGDCTNHEKVDDRPACDQCARANCCEFVLTCDKTPDCGELIKCLDECAGDVFCQLTCSAAHEKGGSVLSDVSSCAKSKCASECPASTPDAGNFFGDAF